MPTITNTDANLSGKTLVVAENAQTITGLQTFDRDPNPPFAVSAGSAAVANLNADKVDGYEASALAVLAENETITGQWTFSGAIPSANITALTIGTSEIHAGIISPAQITANQNNYTPTGWGARIVRLSSDASRDITGFGAGTNGQRVLLSNTGAQNIVLVHGSGLSTTQTICPGAVNFTLNTGDSVEMWYDGASSVWRLVAF